MTTQPPIQPGARAEPLPRVLPEFEVRPAAHSLWSDALRRLTRNRLAVVGGVIIIGARTERLEAQQQDQIVEIRRFAQGLA